MSKKLIGIPVALIGLVLVVSGVIFIVVGLSARAEVIAGLEDEEITTVMKEGEEPVPVNSAETAMNQANLIKQHSLENYGTYSSMARDDPNRDTYIKGLTLRNALIIARMALQITLLIMGLGVLFFLIGISLGGLGIIMASEQ